MSMLAAPLAGNPKKHFPTNFHHQSELGVDRTPGPPSPQSASAIRADLERRGQGLQASHEEPFGSRPADKSTFTDIEDMVLNNPSDVATVMRAVQQNGLCLKYASPELQKDRAIVVAAVKNNGWALVYGPSFKNDREVCLRAVASNAQAVQHCAAPIQDELEKGAVAFSEQEGAKAVPLTEAPVIANWMRAPSVPMRDYAQDELKKLLAGR